MQMPEVMSIHIFQGSQRNYIHILPQGSHKFSIPEETRKHNNANCRNVIIMIFIATMHLDYSFQQTSADWQVDNRNGLISAFSPGKFNLIQIYCLQLIILLEIYLNLFFKHYKHGVYCIESPQQVFVCFVVVVVVLMNQLSYIKDVCCAQSLSHV